MLAIQTSALTRRFRRVVAVRELNLEVPENAIYALMGPNGAGKTTLIKLLMNLMSPSSGRAHVLGEDVDALQGKKLARVGYVSENQKLPGWMTAEMFLRYMRPFYPTWDLAFEQRLMRRFDLSGKQKIKSLSRGMKMKVALASALAFHPRLIILDEPLSGLDPLVRDDLMESLLELVGETTVLFSSHDLAEIESFASHVGYMDGGRLLLSEPMAAVRARFRRLQANLAATAPASNAEASPETSPAAIVPLPEWSQFAQQGQTAQWCETDYDAERSQRRATERLGPVELSSTPMALREVFLAMARTGRSQQPDGGKQ